ncbi:PREDICTED: lysoplasmalogenase [Elephantulus edwardii]|uniref:lysoplasmalogenase n=1 Tax=Elephantulus edwardii TaxID=28737 RepID=UPI0003F0F073|nr:PREDICTED: lysoplasmalogenase [Elephantulus edwardii]
MLTEVVVLSREQAAEHHPNSFLLVRPLRGARSPQSVAGPQSHWPPSEAAGGDSSSMDTRARDLPREPGLIAHILRVAWSLSPFLLTCAAYFWFWIPEAPPSLTGALVKCLPVLSLVLFLRVQAPRGRYTTLLQAALLCSAGGDACLIWPDGFLYGMAAFAGAHLLYVTAFGWRPPRLATLLPVGLACSLQYGLLLPHLPSDLALPVAAYGLVLATMLWRGLARGGSAGPGGLLFTLSDAVLAWDAFAWPLPHARLLVMSTYYAAQALIALSAVGGPRPKAS